MKRMFLGLAMLAVFNVFNVKADSTYLYTKFWLYEVEDGLLKSKIADESVFNSGSWDFSNIKQTREVKIDVDTIAFVVRVAGTKGKTNGVIPYFVAPKIKVSAVGLDPLSTANVEQFPYGEKVKDRPKLRNYYNRDFSISSDWNPLFEGSYTSDKYNNFLEDTTFYSWRTDSLGIDGQPYAVYVIDIKKNAEFNVKVEVDWNETYYDDASKNLRAPKGKKTNLEFELRKSDVLASINSLAELHLIHTKVEDIPGGKFNADFGQELIPNFSPDEFNYIATPWELEKTPTLFFKPLRTGVNVEVTYRGPGIFNGGVNPWEKVASSTWDWVYLPTIGGDVEIKVTAQDGLSVRTYKVSYKQILSETPTVQVPAKWDSTIYKDEINAHLLEYLYVKDGDDTIKLYTLGGDLFDGAIRADREKTSNVEHDPDSNTYIASVPDPNKLDIQILSKFLSRYEYDVVTRAKAKIVWEKKTTSQGEVELIVSVKKPLSATASQLDYTNGTCYQIPAINLISDSLNKIQNKSNATDSIAALKTMLSHILVDVKYTIKLRPNSATLKGIAFRYDSITAPDVTVNYEPDSTIYKEFLLPLNIKKLYVYAEPVDPNVRPEIKLRGRDFSPIEATIGGVRYPGWYRLVDDGSFAEQDIVSGYNLLTINVKAQDSLTKNNYVIYFKKSYDLNLTSLDIKFKNNSLFVEGTPDEAKLKKENTFKVSLPADFVIENLSDITVSANHPTPGTVSVKHYIEAVGQDYKVTIIVKSPDQVKYYYVDLKTAKAITTLNNLFTSTGTLSPAFSPNVREYDLSVPEGTESVTFYSVLTDELAKVTNPLTVNIPKGTTVVTLEVTASNGTTKGSYIINVLNGEVPTGISKVNVKNLVSYSNGQLTISSDSNERIYVLSPVGKLVTSFDKKAGSASISFNRKGVFILNGSSGWVTKVALY